MIRTNRLWALLPAGALLLTLPTLAQTPQPSTPAAAATPAATVPAAAATPVAAPAATPGAATAPASAASPVAGQAGGTPATADDDSALDAAEGQDAKIPANLDAQQEQEALEFLKAESPNSLPQLESLKQSQPRQYRSELRSIFRDLKSLQRIQKDNPERYEEARRERALDRASRELVRRYRASKDDAEREALRTELAAVLDEQFELREKRRNGVIERLEKELAKHREMNEKRRQNKERIVTSRLDDLLGGDQDLKW